MTIGVLSLQGDFKEHLRSIAEHGLLGMEVRNPHDLEQVQALIMPGGESTTMAKLLISSGLDKKIVQRANEGLPIWGTCAGAILLAKHVISPVVLETNLGLIDITVERNSYGRQTESFQAEINFTDAPIRKFVDSDVWEQNQKTKLFIQEKAVSKDLGRPSVFFIRAPRITKVGRGVKVLATHKGDPVLIRQKNILASTFHSELSGKNVVLEYFFILIT